MAHSLVLTTSNRCMNLPRRTAVERGSDIDKAPFHLNWNGAASCLDQRLSTIACARTRTAFQYVFASLAADSACPA